MSLWVFKSFLTAVGEHGRDVINEWYLTLPVQAQAKFRLRLEHLRDRRLPWPLNLAKQLEEGIVELRFEVRNIAYRPLGFFGPERGDFTFLIGTRERGGDFVPKDAINIAIHRKNIILNDKRNAHECGF